MSAPKLSILIPTYNEATDICATLEAACAVRHADKEILVIDDASTDNTSAIVRGFTDCGVQLLSMPENRGVAAARNVGLQAAQGEIVVILNADAHLPSDFAEKVLKHYEAGADYVVVESAVENGHALYPRYVQLMHQYQYHDPRLVEWSEGYSCRRSAALALGGFPEIFPDASGEDAIFGEQMASRYKKAWDPGIVVRHVAPESLDAFWRQRVGRGRGSAYRLFGYGGAPLSMLRMARAWLGLLLIVGTLIPMLLQGARLARLSPRRWRDWLPMVWAHAVDRCGWQVGYWRGFLELCKSRPLREDA